MSCLFCKIINKEIPAEIVYEDDFVLAFLDINPVNPGHTLVIPKNHCDNLLDANEDDLKKMIVAIPKIAKAVMVVYQYKGFNCDMNNGAVAGQVIKHLHFHIVPRKTGDGLQLSKGKVRTEEKLKIDAEKIREHLSMEIIKQ